jgi:hypothetical protein
MISSLMPKVNGPQGESVRNPFGLTGSRLKSLGRDI